MTDWRWHTLKPLGVVANEFATIGVSIDKESLDPRLRLVDVRNGREAVLDAAQLEAIVWAPRHLLQELADPGLTPWGHREQQQ